MVWRLWATVGLTSRCPIACHFGTCKEFKTTWYLKMSSRVVISRLGQVGALFRFKHTPCVWGSPAVWNRAYSQDTNNTGPSGSVTKSTSVMNATWMGENLYAKVAGPITEKLSGPLRPWVSAAAGECTAKYAHQTVCHSPFKQGEPPWLV